MEFKLEHGKEYDVAFNNDIKKLIFSGVYKENVHSDDRKNVWVFVDDCSFYWVEHVVYCNTLNRTINIKLISKKTAWTLKGLGLREARL